MDRQTNERVDRGTDKCTNGRTDRHHTDGPSDLRTDRQTSFGRTDRHMDGPTDIRTDKQISWPNHSSCFKFHLFAYLIMTSLALLGFLLKDLGDGV